MFPFANGRQMLGLSHRGDSRSDKTFKPMAVWASCHAAKESQWWVIIKGDENVFLFKSFKATWGQSGLNGLLEVFTYPRFRLEGGACVMTEVGDGMVGWSASKPKCSGREPGRTIVGVGPEILGGVSLEKNGVKLTVWGSTLFTTPPPPV